MFGIPDWSGMFVPKVPFAELLIRGSLMYLAIFALMRFILKRQAGSMSLTDLLVVVLIADASQNGMAGDYKDVPGGIVVVGTIVFWSAALDYLAFHIPWLGRLLHPPPLELVRDGRLNRRNLRHELITVAELMSQLRENDIENLTDCKRAWMEGDGHISAIKK